eukprot:scaffold107675_cov24-Tisochrysis_lutea.AAC.4
MRARPSSPACSQTISSASAHSANRSAALGSPAAAISEPALPVGAAARGPARRQSHVIVEDPR